MCVLCYFRAPIAFRRINSSLWFVLISINKMKQGHASLISMGITRYLLEDPGRLSGRGWLRDCGMWGETHVAVWRQGGQGILPGPPTCPAPGVGATQVFRCVLLLLDTCTGTKEESHTKKNPQAHMSRFQQPSGVISRDTGTDKK